MGKRKQSSPASNKSLSAEQRDALVGILESRFEEHPERHKRISWKKVAERLKAHPDALWSLNEMERTGGEPDVVQYDKKADKYVFMDCAPESPKGRRSICYDQAALEARKQHKPKDSAMNVAASMGIEMLTEEEYRALQKLGEFDLKTSSWLQTPSDIRALGGAIFGDRRYDTVFVYHNGAESYYAARGFRGVLRV